MDPGRKSTGGRIDTRVPYRIDLGDGRSVVVFFYDGPLSREIAFDGLLKDGKALAHRLSRRWGSQGTVLGWPMSQPTVRLTAIITGTGKWLWRSLWRRSTPVPRRD